jgi:hypothetical protein
MSQIHLALVLPSAVSPHLIEQFLVTISCTHLPHECPDALRHSYSFIVEIPSVTSSVTNVIGSGFEHRGVICYSVRSFHFVAHRTLNSEYAMAQFPELLHCKSESRGFDFRGVLKFLIYLIFPAELGLWSRISFQKKQVLEIFSAV